MPVSGIELRPSLGAHPDLSPLGLSRHVSDKAMDSKQRYFVTEHGHRIDFVPEYRERNNLVALDALPAQPPAKTQVSGLTPFSAKTFVSFSVLLGFLERAGLRKEHGTVLELGGGIGLVSALLKASGIAKHITMVDLVNHADARIEQYYKSIVDFMGALDNESAMEFARAALVFAKASYNLCPGQPLMAGIEREFPHRPSVDEFLWQDMFETSGNYDLVVSVGVMDVYDLDRSLSKARTLLRPGGVLVCMEEHWWWPANTCGVVGHFPYALQRLSYKDLERYVGEHHPELSSSLEARYGYLYGQGEPPSLRHWITKGKSHGLRPVAMEGIVPHWSHRANDCPPAMMQSAWFNPDDALRDIRYRRPDVALGDLLTSVACVAYVAQ